MKDIEKLAIDATIKHEQALFDLMRHTDMRANGYIGLYAGLAGGSAALLSSPWLEQAPPFAYWLFAAYGVSVVMAAVAALICVRSTKFATPAREAEFWSAVIKRSDDVAVAEFLKGSTTRLEFNSRLQDKAAFWLDRATMLGIVAAVLGVAGMLASKASFVGGSATARGSAAVHADHSVWSAPCSPAPAAIGADCGPPRPQCHLYPCGR
jgi:hypothetical protein